MFRSLRWVMSLGDDALHFKARVRAAQDTRSSGKRSRDMASHMLIGSRSQKCTERVRLIRCPLPLPLRNGDAASAATSRDHRPAAGFAAGGHICYHGPEPSASAATKWDKFPFAMPMQMVEPPVCFHLPCKALSGSGPRNTGVMRKGLPPPEDLSEHEP